MTNKILRNLLQWVEAAAITAEVAATTAEVVATTAETATTAAAATPVYTDEYGKHDYTYEDAHKTIMSLFGSKDHVMSHNEAREEWEYERFDGAACPQFDMNYFDDYRNDTLQELIYDSEITREEMVALTDFDLSGYFDDYVRGYGQINHAEIIKRCINNYNYYDAADLIKSAAKTS